MDHDPTTSAVTIPPPSSLAEGAVEGLLSAAVRLVLGAGKLRRRIHREIIADLDERLATIARSAGDSGIDAFGMEPAALRTVSVGAALLYRYYFRCQAEGLENLPPGPAILVANHGGQLPIDGVMITTALLLDGDPPRLARSLADHWVPTLPFVSTLYARCGVVLGSPENARRLLAEGATLLVFPEGIAGISKTIDRAYELQPFGPGFLRLAIETGAPVVPVAVVGSEEQYPTLYNLQAVSKALSLPSFPIWAQMAIPVLGLLPLPVRYRLRFGEALRFAGDQDEEDAVIFEKVEEVRGRLRELIRETRATRRSVFW
ncbi:MAG TPA: 1-acyl-sn-glycerol-3-phosphate acyltransferase [Polyangia bacterium]|nr:1-acyl-sn-glycerol-3-phosphate acyltransferase [Polyangia bacterium]